jgi:hypothetical protein
MSLHTPELISQISETVNESNAKKIRIMIILKTPDYPVLVFSPHMSTQNMQIKSHTGIITVGEKIAFCKLCGKKTTFTAPKYAALSKVCYVFFETGS